MPFREEGENQVPEKLGRGIPLATEHLLQLDQAFGDTEQRVYKHRLEGWTVISRLSTPLWITQNIQELGMQCSTLDGRFHPLVDIAWVTKYDWFNTQNFRRSYHGIK